MVAEIVFGNMCDLCLVVSVHVFICFSTDSGFLVGVNCWHAPKTIAKSMTRAPPKKKHKRFIGRADVWGGGINCAFMHV